MPGILQNLPIGAAEGCDLFDLRFLKTNIKRSQPSAAPTRKSVFCGHKKSTPQGASF
jgi:hypothetical protein